jgi:hypothetical protein
VKTAVEPEPHAIDLVREVGQALRGTHPPVPAQASLPDHAVHSMQGSLGNRATRRVLAGGILQPKLTVGAPDDIYEKEADAVAEQVLAQTSHAAASSGGSDDDHSNPRSVARKAADQESVQRSILRRIPIRTLQQTLGNRALT